MTAITARTPVVIIGSGPIGLAAAAHLEERGLAHRILEAGDQVAAAVRSWGHVRLFSPYGQLIDPVAAELLAATGWTAPDREGFPTGRDWVHDYLDPLAAALEVEVETGSRVVGIARQGRDALSQNGRAGQPLVVHAETPDGPRRFLAGAVVDASGTTYNPNPLGADGLTALGERQLAHAIAYGIPDLDEPSVRARHLGAHTAVVGSGDSAMTSILALARMIDEDPATKVTWVVRRTPSAMAAEAEDDDPLTRRAGLGAAAAAQIAAGRVQLVGPFRTEAIAPDGRGGRITLRSSGGDEVRGIDRVIVATGFRPDLAMTRELHLSLDPVTEAPAALADLIDPNVHTCNSVPPHGEAQLAHPEPGYYAIGLKSYGRAPTFLALTGYEQVRSVVAKLAGDEAGARDVRLVLPGIATPL